MKPTTHTIEQNTLGMKHPTQAFDETTKERIMNTIKLMSAIVAGLTFGVSQAAKATDWADFSQFNSFVTLASANQEDTTVLRTVTVVCPVKGYLIARAESRFFLQGGGDGHATVNYSLTLDSVAPIAYDPNHAQAIEGYDPDGGIFIPASIQRIVSCTAGQSVTVNYVAWRENSNGPLNSASQPKLSVDFFDKRI